MRSPRLVARVGHGLTAAGLLFGENDLATKALEQLQGGDPHLWVELIDITWDEQADLHKTGRDLGEPKYFNPIRSEGVALEFQ